MSRFETEIDVIHHSSLRESFRYAKLIGLSENEDVQKMIVEQEIVWHPNAPQ